MKLGAIIAVVSAGILYGFVAPGQFAFALGHATLYVFLPPLLFEAAWNLNYRAIVRQWRAIATLAGPGVIVTAAIIAGALWLIHVPLLTGLLVGAILSATDPIAVVAVFRKLPIPKTLATIVECEALFNDATAVVLYGGVLAISQSGTHLATLVAFKLFAGALGGIAFGAIVAFVAARSLHTFTRARVQIPATVVCAYGSYLVADMLHMSGIFAVIACGIALRYFERRWLSLRIAADVGRAWDVAALACNVLVFFMVGAALPLDSLLRFPAFIGATIVGVAVSRIIVPSSLAWAGFPSTWLAVIRVAGLRSALSLALALALPASTPDREAIIDATFAVALTTIAIGGPLVPYFAARSSQRR